MTSLTLIVNEFDVSDRLSTYQVNRVVEYSKVVTTMDNTEHAIPRPTRPEISFTVFPMTDEESTLFYNALSPLIFTAQFTDPNTGRIEVKRVRVTTNINSTFLLLSVDGKRRYKGNTITLRVL